MKKLIFVFGAITMICMASCSENSTKADETDSVYCGIDSSLGDTLLDDGCCLIDSVY